MSKLSRRKFISATGQLFAISGITSGIPGLISPVESRPIESIRKKTGMKVGVDADKLYAVKSNGPIAILDFADKHGFDGVFFRTMLDLSPTLDEHELADIKTHADQLGLYLDSGAGWMNPYNTAETPHVRRFGNGDYRLAVEMMIKAAREIDCTELYAVSGHSIHGDPFFVAYDRFRTDVSWEDQLFAMKKFILMLKPLLQDLGCRLNLETHGDETSHELLRLIDEIGPDVLGVTLDTGNLPLSGDVPMDAINRLASFIHMTHCKDGILYRTKEGIVQQLRTVDQGIVDWEKALKILGKSCPDLHLSFEDYRAENLIRMYDPEWRKHFPDMTDEDILEFERLAQNCEERIRVGEIPGIKEFNSLPFGNNERLQSYKSGAEYLRKIIKANGL
ncbi:sugar phosphate isomerase/epimerase family protein [Bacteroidota bacterium]